MSRSIYYFFGTDGKLADSKELRNGHGSVPVIWDHIVSTYEPGALWLTAIASFWEQPAKFARLSADDRFIFRATYDRHLLRRRDFDRFVALVQPISARVPAGHANHWPEVLPWLQSRAEDPAILGFGMYPMSVSENVWLKKDGTMRDARYVPRV